VRSLQENVATFVVDRLNQPDTFTEPCICQWLAFPDLSVFHSRFFIFFCDCDFYLPDNTFPASLFIGLIC
jgi:hypothetical protein